MNATVRAACAVLSVVALFAAGCLHAEKTDDERNDEILRALPVFPEATIVTSRSSPYYSEDDPDEPLGHTRGVVYRVPTGTTAASVVRFYRSRLSPTWDCSVETTGPPVLLCTKGSALVSVNTDNIGSRPPRFEVGVNHEGAR